MKNKYYTIDKQKDKEIITIKEMPVLYKYQTINEHSVNALINNEVWATVPTNFNDPYDMIFCYSSSHIKGVIKDKLSYERVLKYSKFFETKSKMAIIKSISDSLLSNFNDNFRKQYCVACFSEVFDSEIMWGHYANCAKGFVIAYSGNDLMSQAFAKNETFFELSKQFNFFNIDFSNVKKDNLTTIAPIIYSNGKKNFDNEIIDSLDPLLEYFDDLCENKTVEESINTFIKKIQQKYFDKNDSHNDSFYSALCNKHKSWSYEKEWRIWSYNSNALTGQLNDPYVCIGNVKPKAIYLGEKINPYEEQAILSIAKEKLHIPVYKMKTKMFKNRCRLQAELLYKGAE